MVLLFHLVDLLQKQVSEPGALFLVAGVVEVLLAPRVVRLTGEALLLDVALPQRLLVGVVGYTCQTADLLQLVHIRVVDLHLLSE